MTTSTAALGHGMGAAWEEKDWPHITLTDVQTLQLYYPALKGKIQILWHSPRPFSSAAIVEVAASHQQYFIKRSHRSFRQAQDLLEEHAFIEHLAAKNIPVVPLVRSSQGKTALELGDWSYEVHHKAHAFDLYAEQQSWTAFFYPEHAAKAGQLLAKLHNAAVDFDIRQGRSARYLVCNQTLLESDNIVEAIYQRIDQSPELTRYFSNQVMDAAFLNYIAELHRGIKKTFQCAAKIWTHNDLHASNLLWTAQSNQAEIAALFDFGLADYNSALYDFSTAIERNFIDWLQLSKTQALVIDYDGLTAFIQAYFSHQTGLTDFSILPSLLQIVHIDFALSELEYFVGITGNSAHADAAYHDWLVGHVDWFRSESGQCFINRLSHLISDISATHANLATPAQCALAQTQQASS